MISYTEYLAMGSSGDLRETHTSPLPMVGVYGVLPQTSSPSTSVLPIRRSVSCVLPISVSLPPRTVWSDQQALRSTCEMDSSCLFIYFF